MPSAHVSSGPPVGGTRLERPVKPCVAIFTDQTTPAAATRLPIRDSQRVSIARTLAQLQPSGLAIPSTAFSNLRGTCARGCSYPLPDLGRQPHGSLRSDRGRGICCLTAICR